MNQQQPSDDTTKPREIAVDFDSTLARYDHWRGVEHLGEPVPEMVAKVKAALAEGAHVRIFSARIYPGGDWERARDATRSFELLAAWCRKHLGVLLPITYVKAPEVQEYWDDRAREVVPNHGIFATELLDAAAANEPDAALAGQHADGYR